MPQIEATVEALNLSATTFHTDIDAWLPASFGLKRSEKDKADDWDAALRSSANRADRLGLGHPSLEDPVARAKAQTARAGIDLLSKKLKNGKAAAAGNAEDAAAERWKGRRDGDSSDDESRTKAVPKVKKKKTDAFGSKKAAAVHPLLNLKNPIPGYDPEAAAKPAREETEPSAGKKRQREDEDGSDAEAEAEADNGPASSKAAMRREKRKRAKQRKAAAAAAA